MSGSSAEVDHSVCIGYAECARVAPAAFHLNNNNQSDYIARSAESEAVLVAAAKECPTNAIRVLAPDGTVVFESG